MAYSERLAERVRDELKDIRKVSEKKMFGGLAFLVNAKMCVGVDKDDLMVRCEPEMTDALLAKKGARIFDMTGKPMKGWLLVGPAGTKSRNDLVEWIQISLETNKNAAAAKRKK